MNTTDPTITDHNRWTHIMLMILRENFDSMTDKELAGAIGKPVTAIERKIKELQLFRPRPAIKTAASRRRAKEVEVTVSTLEKKQRLNREQEREASKKRESRKVIKTRQVDYTTQRSVRIDSKTWVYAKPGDDIEKLKKKYTRSFSKDGLSKIDW